MCFQLTGWRKKWCAATYITTAWMLIEPWYRNASSNPMDCELSLSMRTLCRLHGYEVKTSGSQCEKMYQCCVYHLSSSFPKDFQIYLNTNLSGICSVHLGLTKSTCCTCGVQAFTSCFNRLHLFVHNVHRGSSQWVSQQQSWKGGSWITFVNFLGTDLECLQEQYFSQLWYLLAYDEG